VTLGKATAPSTLWEQETSTTARPAQSSSPVYQLRTLPLRGTHTRQTRRASHQAVRNLRHHPDGIRTGQHDRRHKTRRLAATTAYLLPAIVGRGEQRKRLRRDLPTALTAVHYTVGQPGISATRYVWSPGPGVDFVDGRRKTPDEGTSGSPTRPAQLRQTVSAGHPRRAASAGPSTANQRVPDGRACTRIRLVKPERMFLLRSDRFSRFRYAGGRRAVEPPCHTGDPSGCPRSVRALKLVRPPRGEQPGRRWVSRRIPTSSRTRSQATTDSCMLSSTFNDGWPVLSAGTEAGRVGGPVFGSRQKIPAQEKPVPATFVGGGLIAGKSSNQRPCTPNNRPNHTCPAGKAR